MIYLIDDDTDSAFLFTTVFKKHFIDQPILHYASGKTALEDLARGLKLPKLILLDLNLPDMSGLAILTRLKKHIDWKCIPVIIWSHDVDPQQVVQCYDAGANSFINKPLDGPSIIKVVKTLYKYWFDVNTLPRQ